MREECSLITVSIRIRIVRSDERQNAVAVSSIRAFFLPGRLGSGLAQYRSVVLPESGPVR